MSGTGRQPSQHTSPPTSPRITPTTEWIRTCFLDPTPWADPDRAAVDFDAWLVAHDAEVREQDVASVAQVDAFVRAINNNGFVLDRAAVRAGLLAAAVVSDPQRRNEE